MARKSSERSLAFSVHRLWPTQSALATERVASVGSENAPWSPECFTVTSCFGSVIRSSVLLSREDTLVAVPTIEASAKGIDQILWIFHLYRYNGTPQAGLGSEVIRTMVRAFYKSCCNSVMKNSPVSSPVRYVLVSRKCHRPDSAAVPFSGQ